MTARNLHRAGGAVARLATEALAGRCGIGQCPEPAAGYLQGTSGRPAGVCSAHTVEARRRGYTVHTEAPGPSDRP
jgi:hypothetical protein